MYYGEEKQEATLLPPTSLIAANKRDYVPDPGCFYRGYLSVPRASTSTATATSTFPYYLSEARKMDCRCVCVRVFMVCVTVSAGCAHRNPSSTLG